MSSLFRQIQTAVAENRYLVSVHAANQMEDRGIMEWQVVDALDTAALIRERPNDVPNPAIEAEEILADGTPFRSVWSWLPYHRAAKLVTVHFLDR